jgi:hypothetical protein
MDKEAASIDFARVGWLFSRVMILDPDPYNVIVGFTIHHMSRLHGREEPAVAIKHKLEGMRLINARLGDPGQAISDGNIGAVANFTSHEVSHPHHRNVNSSLYAFPSYSPEPPKILLSIWGD